MCLESYAVHVPGAVIRRAEKRRSPLGKLRPSREGLLPPRKADKMNRASSVRYARTAKAGRTEVRPLQEKA